MICFQVEINGTKFCTAGVGEFGVLTSVLSMVRNRQSVAGAENGAPVQLTLGGRTSLSENVGENVEWPSASLGVGDEIRITITDSQPDDPAQRTPSDPALELVNAKAHYQWLVAEMEREAEAHRGG